MLLQHIQCKLFNFFKQFGIHFGKVNAILFYLRLCGYAGPTVMSFYISLFPSNVSRRGRCSNNCWLSLKIVTQHAHWFVTVHWVWQLLYRNRHATYSFFICAFVAMTFSSCLSFCPGGWPWSNILFTLIGISLFSYSLAVQLPLLKGQHGRTGRNTLQPWVNNSLTSKFNFMSKKKAEPKKNKPTQKKSSAQRKADPKKKAR